MGLRFLYRMSNSSDSRQMPNEKIQRDCNESLMKNKYFYYISEMNEIYKALNNCDSFSKRMFEKGNFFETLEEAHDYMINNNMIIWNELKKDTILIDNKNKEYKFLYFEHLNHSCFVTDMETNKDKFIFINYLKLKES